MDFTEKILELFGQSGKADKELATIFGISQGNISDWRRGRSKPSAKVIPVIAAYFNVTTDYIYYGDTEKKAPDQGLSKIEEDLLECFRNISPEAQHLVFRVAENEYLLREKGGQRSRIAGKLLGQSLRSQAENQA